MQQPQAIRLASSTPLPCSVFNPQTGAICGKAATAGYVYPLEKADSPGQWILQPICRACDASTQAVYQQ